MLSYENVDRPPQAKQGGVCNGTLHAVKDRNFTTIFATFNFSNEPLLHVTDCT